MTYRHEAECDFCGAIEELRPFLGRDGDQGWTPPVGWICLPTGMDFCGVDCGKQSPGADGYDLDYWMVK